MLDRKLLKNIDWPLWGIVLAISIFSVFVIASASQNAAPGAELRYVRAQLTWIVIGNGLIAFSLFFDYRLLVRLLKLIYVANIGLLASVLLFGRTAGGAQRWIPIGGFALQPSEFAKLVIIIVLAHYFEQRGPVTTMRELIVTGVLVFVPMGLIVIQPDLGTALVFIFVFFGMLYAAGSSLKYLIGMTVSGLLASPLVWMYGLKDYQRNRLLVFLNPEAPEFRSNIGWHLIQSMIAIGTGRFFGVGWRAGTQNRLNFLPEQHTDFIFSVVGEEFGFIGCVLLLIAFLLLLQRMLNISKRAKDEFGRLIVMGVVLMMMFQIFTNVGMAIGIMPITGLPLPFMSYGGSSYLTFAAAIALTLNVGMRRHKILF